MMRLAAENGGLTLERGEALEDDGVVDPIGEEARRCCGSVVSELGSMELCPHDHLVHAGSRGHQLEVVHPLARLTSTRLDRDRAEGV